MTELKPDILVVEDEEAILMVLQYNLEKAGFTVRIAETGVEALEQVETKIPDIMLLDWMLPELSGVEVCKRLRGAQETRNIPVIMVTARGEEADELQGLEAGADDYVVKPFSPAQLIARIKAVLRRTRPVLLDKKLEFAGITLDTNLRRATINSKEIKLGPTEFKLLMFLMEHPRQVFSREQLLDRVWGNDAYLETRTVDVHIRRVRKALEDTRPGLENIIKTLRSAGYSLDDAVE